MRKSIVAVVVASAPLGTAHAGSYLDMHDLLVSMRCGESLATPDNGLQVTVDGSQQQGELEGQNLEFWNRHGPYERWVPIDVGFDVAPGPHHLAVGAPGCATEERDILVDPAGGPVSMQGRLAVTDSSLEGPVGAPNGIGIAFGAFEAAMAGQPGNVWGGVMTTSYEHRAFALAVDIGLGAGSAPDMNPLTGSTFLMQMRTAVRTGFRLRFHDAALEAGTGIGGTMALGPAGNGYDAFAPLWAGLTVKPSCNWGVQLTTSYDVYLTASEHSLSTIAGVIWQPSNACSDPVGVVVRRADNALPMY